ncbi:hypothetical protein C8J57DRAFT_1722456 [Mycena rebaudengoi]|nr:hypothetical protein C8J57DRAFT_1722456 [Mycena rebaudengoi]
MSAPHEKLQKPLLLQGIAPHLFQTRKPLSPHKLWLERAMDETTAGHQKTSSGSSVNTLSEALQELGILQHQNQSLREENNNLQNQLEACRANLHEAGQAMMAIAEIHEANGKGITRLDQFLKRVTTEVNKDEV